MTRAVRSPSLSSKSTKRVSSKARIPSTPLTSTSTMNPSTSPNSLKKCCKTPPLIFRETSNFSGNGIRILFSPLSKILSLHCFNLNPYGITDRKYYNEINGYVDQQMYQVINEENNKAKVNVFLKTKKNICAKKRDLEDFEIINSIVPIVIYLLMIF